MTGPGEGTKPFGSPSDPVDPFDPWPWSYEIYSTLATMKLNLRPEQVGIYLGITNCSCYGRDLPQPEPVSWYVPGVEPEGIVTGFGNLIRDTLICKHFGVEEVTFFLPWTVIEHEYSMGGTFEAYGLDFLDVVNETMQPEEVTLWLKR